MRYGKKQQFNERGKVTKSKKVAFWSAHMERPKVLCIVSSAADPDDSKGIRGEQITIKLKDLLAELKEAGLLNS